MINKIFYLILFAGFIFCCSMDYKKANDKAVEKLRMQIIEGKYEEIYEQSSSIVKNTISKDEFVNRMEIAVQVMKEVDGNLNWQKNETEEGFYIDHPVSENSYRLLENDKKVGIFIYWAKNFTLCGFETSSSDKNSEIRVVQGCS